MLGTPNTDISSGQKESLSALTIHLSVCLTLDKYKTQAISNIMLWLWGAVCVFGKFFLTILIGQSSSLDNIFTIRPYVNCIPYGPIYGPVWSRMVLYGPFIVPYGPVWCHIVPYGPIWSSMVPYGHLWSHMVPYSPLWSRVVLYSPVLSRIVCIGLLIFKLQNCSLKSLKVSKSRQY